MELKGNEAERWGQIYNPLKELNERIEDNLQKLNKLNEESAAICESIATDKATIEQLVDTAKKGQFSAQSNNLNVDGQTNQSSIYFEQFISILNAAKTEEENCGNKVDTEPKHSDACSDKPEENVQEQQVPLSEPEQQKDTAADNETESTDAVEKTGKETEEPQQETSKKSKKAKHSSEMSGKQQTLGFDTGTETEKRDE